MSDVESETEKVCNRCHVMLDIDFFLIKKNGTRRKLCFQCNEKSVIYKKKNKVIKS